MSQNIKIAVIANPFGKTTTVLSRLSSAGIQFQVYKSLTDYHNSTLSLTGCPVLMAFRDTGTITAQCISDLRKSKDVPVYVYAEYLDIRTIRQLFLAGAEDVVESKEINEKLLSKWLNTHAISLRHEQQQIREFERVVRRGSFLEVSLAEGKLPNYYRNTNRIEFLRCDVTTSNESTDSWRHLVVSEWIHEFGGNASFVFLRPNSFLGLRIGAMVDIDLENRVLFRSKLAHRLERFFEAVGIHGCICAASSCNAEYLDCFVANSLDMQNEQLFFLNSSQYIPNRQARNSYVVDNSEYEQFGKLLTSGYIAEATALLTRIVIDVCESRPKPSYAHEIIHNFAKISAAVYKQDAYTFMPFPSRTMNYITMRDQLVERIRLASKLSSSSPDPVLRGNHQIATIVATINANPTQNYTAESTAYQLGYSRSHFCRVFTLHVGESFGSYVRKQKLIYAGELLKKTNFGIKEVGSIVGYPNTSYFRKIFEAYHKYNPEDFRFLQT